MSHPFHSAIRKPISTPRVAIIGLGFGAGFIPIQQRHPNTVMAAICQRHPETLNVIGDKFGIAKRYTDDANVLGRLRRRAHLRRERFLRLLPRGLPARRQRRHRRHRTRRLESQSGHARHRLAAPLRGTALLLQGQKRHSHLPRRRHRQVPLRPRAHSRDQLHLRLPRRCGRPSHLIDRGGTITVIKDGRAFEVVATNSLGEGVEATPAPVGRQLLVRGERSLFCLE